MSIQADASAVAPDWFIDAVNTPGTEFEVGVDGARVRARHWGPPGDGLVLIHGGAAHARWWDHIAPLLAADSRVVALDLTGHGDSDRRGAYDLSLWAREVLAAADAGGISGSPVIVGHSMGGWVALTTGAEHATAVAGVIAIDSPVRTLTPEESAARHSLAFGPLRHYPSFDEALRRFRVVPDDPWTQPYIEAYIARHSIVRRAAGWTWKFDPRIFDRPRPTPELLTSIRCRVALFRAERGLVTSDIGEQMYDLLGRAAPVISLPLAGHHAMLDEPVALAVGLRTLLADWRHSAPAARNGGSK
jgi:pimeloyl-ACP methyl ester carboxylesterase